MPISAGPPLHTSHPSTSTGDEELPQSNGDSHTPTVEDEDHAFEEENNEHDPSYAAVTLVYGVQVDAYSLIYHARAYLTHRPAFRFLAACQKKKIESSSQFSPVSLPTEVLENIACYLRDDTLEEASCESWLYLGNEGVQRFHPRYCCARNKQPVQEWPASVQGEWESARDHFVEHFSFAVPRCIDPCGGHHVCKVRLLLSR